MSLFLVAGRNSRKVDLVPAACSCRYAWLIRRASPGHAMFCTAPTARLEPNQVPVSDRGRRLILLANPMVAGLIHLRYKGPCNQAARRHFKLCATQT